MKAYSQRGMSMLSMLVAVIIVASVMLLAVKILPLYIDDFAIGKAVESLKTESNLYAMNKENIRGVLSRKLSADYTRPLTKDEIVITKNKGDILIEVIYESRVPVVYNLDVVAKFSHRLEQKK